MRPSNVGGGGRRWWLLVGPVVLLLVALLGLRGSSVTQPSAGGVCATCTYPDTTILGGLIGGLWGNAASNASASPFAVLGNARMSYPTTGALTGLVACISAANQPDAILQTWYEVQDSIAVNQSDMLIPPTLVLSDAAAGCYQNDQTIFLTQEGSNFNVQSVAANLTPTIATAWSTSVVGARAQPLMGHYNGQTVAAGGTTFGNVGQGTAFNTTEATIDLPLPITGTFQKLAISTSTAQPATGTLVLTLLDNSVATACIITIPVSGAAGIYRDVTNTCAVAAGQFFAWQLVNNAAAGSAAVNTISMEFVPTNPDHKGLLVYPKRFFALTAASTAYAKPFATDSLCATETDCTAGMPRGYTVFDPACFVQTAPAANTTTATFRRNEAASAVSVSITVAGGTGTITGAGSEAYAALDTVGLEFVTGAGAVPAVSGCIAGLQ